MDKVFVIFYFINVMETPECRATVFLCFRLQCDMTLWNDGMCCGILLI